MLWAKFLFIACACFATTALAQNYEFYDETTADYSMAPIMADDPSAATEERPRPDRCPKWGDWKNVTCWWPSMTFTDLPQECTYMPLPKKIPKVVQDLIRGKAQEAYDAIVYEYEQRGKPAKCGYCSRSFRCRSRNITKTDDAENSMLNDFDRRHHRHGRRGHDQCKPKEIQPVHDECDDHTPCELKKVNGICKTPFFLNPAKIDRVQKLMKQRDHQGAADELFASMNGNEERRKRQAGFSDDYGSDVYGNGYGYGMNPQFDSRNGFGDGERRGSFGFNGRRPGRQGPPQPFGPGPENEGRQFDPRQGPSFGPGNDRRPMPPPFGPRDDDRQGSDERRGRQGPPPSFGPGDEGQRGPFGPREDERRGPFEPDGRRGRQGPPPPQPFGPSGDDDERPPPPFGPPDEEGRRGPFGPRDGDRRGPSEGRRGRHGPPPPPFGPGGNDDRRGPFGPRSDDRRGPFGPGSRRGRHGPAPPPFGSGGDERRGREWPPRLWGPPGGRHHGKFPPRHGGGPWGFGGNQENEEFNQRQTSMWQTGVPNRGKDSRGFVYRLLHDTNCVNANGTCLCCCGPYIPNVANKTCDDLRQLFPGIEDTADALMGIDKNQDSESPPTEEPMEEISPSSELPFEEMPTPQRRQSPDGPAGPAKIPKPEHDFK